jgi:SAM-dependent methyltransferase
MRLMPTAVRNAIRAVLAHTPGLASRLREFESNRRFHPLAAEEAPGVISRLSRSWSDDGIPARQREVVDRQLAEYRAGKPNAGFDALTEILLHNVPNPGTKTLLEIGCASGYYAEVLRLRNVTTAYRGCDFSPALVRLARQTDPSVQFDIEDATRLSYGEDSFDIVVSGCCILHIPEYERAIAEAARVAREFVVFHSTPVVHLTGPWYYTKKAYGVEMVEIHFNEQKLLRTFARHGLHLRDINTHQLVEKRTGREFVLYKTYLCRKVK